jgi:pimeloyl-ACP methyl ester carboxylesterase
MHYGFPYAGEMMRVMDRMLSIQTTDGPLDVHITEMGSGPPLLLLHGWPQHSHSWRRVAELLERDFRLIMPDLRGFGRSAVPAGGYNPRQFADDAIALLDALDIRQAGVIGHDWGGFSTYLIGLSHPERVTGLVVCNAPHPWARLDAQALIELWRLWYVLVIGSPAGPRLLEGGRFIPWFLRLGGRTRVFDDATAERYAAPLREPPRARASQLLYRHYLKAAKEVFIRHAHSRRRLTVPTRAVFGADDYYVTVSSTLGAQHHADDWRLNLLDGCGHWTPEERPDAVAAAARELF